MPVEGLWDRVACDVELFDRLTETRPTSVSALASSQYAGAGFGSLTVTLQYETSRGCVLAQIQLDENDDGECDSISATLDGLRLDLLERGSQQIDLLVNGEPQELSACDSRVETYRYFASCINANRELAPPDPGLDVARTLDAARRSLQTSGRMATV